MQMNAGAPLNRQATAVYGLQIENPQAAMLTQRVLTLALVAAVVVLAGGVLTLVEAGAVLSTTFSTCSLAGVEMSCSELKTYIWTSTLLTLLVGLAVPFCGYQGARGNNKDLLGCFCGMNLFCGACDVCSLITTIGALGAGGLGVVSVLLAIGLGVLHFCSFWWGKALREELTRGVVIHAPPPAVYAQSNVQPVQAYAAPSNVQAYAAPSNVQPVQAYAAPTAPAMTTFDIELAPAMDFSLGIQLDSAQLAIVEITAGGPMHAHNLANPQAVVQPGDRFVVINGVHVSTLEQYHSAVRLAPRVRATLARAAPVFAGP